MSSYLSDTEKAAIETEFHNVFDTLKRPLIVYSAPEKIYASTDPNFSRFGQFGQNNEMQNEDINQQQYQTIQACILYNKNPDFEQYNKDKTGGTYEQLKVRDVNLKVRIKVDIDGYNVLKDAKLLQLDGLEFLKDSPPRPHGLFGATRWSFFFKLSV